MAKCKIGIKIMPRPEVLDSQGRAVSETLVRLGHKGLECRVGRYIDLEFLNCTQESALEQAEHLAREIFSNPLIESFSLEVLS